MDLSRVFNDHPEDVFSLAKRLPCFLHINDPVTKSIVYLDPEFKSRLVLPDGMTFEKASKTLPFVHPEDLERAIESVSHYLEHKEEFSTVSFLQRVQTSDKGWVTLYTTSLYREDLGGLVSFSVELDRINMVEKDLDIILEETDFIKRNFQKFGLLTQKELVFIRYWVKNLKLSALADKMSVTVSTAKTYKKRIYAKLEINSYTELWKYAVAFDLL